MPRRPRISTGGYAYHVLNRAVGRATLFDKDDDFAAFEHVLEQTHARLPIRLVSYCLMPNHWHLILWPKQDGQLSEFMRLLTVTHTQRWHARAITPPAPARSTKAASKASPSNATITSSPTAAMSNAIPSAPTSSRPPNSGHGPASPAAAAVANNSAATWQTGDFNYDGVRDSADYALMTNAYANQGAPSDPPPRY